MAEQRVTLTFTDPARNFDGTLRSYMSPPDQVAFERTYDRSIARLEQDGIRIEWLLWFIWRALKREGQEVPDFETFLDTLEDYEMPEVEETPDPTPAEVQPA